MSKLIATRYLPALVVLLAMACVPTILHSYMGAGINDGRSADALPLHLNELQGRPSGRSPAWVQDAYGTTDFIERHYGPHLTLFVARSFDPKGLYHHPEHGVARGDGYDRATVVRLPSRPDVPIFELTAPDRLSVYALLHEGEFIADPIRFQLRNAFTSLIRRRTPMTLFFVRSRTAPTTPPAPEASPAHTLLLAAIDGFVAQAPLK